MAENTQAQADVHGAAHGPKRYWKIYYVLLGLFAVSVLGPMVGVRWLTLITAFGIALVKAYLVAANFMHLDIERRYVSFFLVTAVVFMLLLFAGVAPDVMNHEGHQWVNHAARAVTGEAEPRAASADAPAEFSAAQAYATSCATCHGAQGAGDGAAAAALTPRPANFTDPAFWATRDRAAVLRAIRDGGPAVGRSPLMAAFSAQFDGAQLEALADLVVGFAPEAAQPEAAQPEAAQPEAARPEAAQPEGMEPPEAAAPAQAAPGAPL